MDLLPKNHQEFRQKEYWDSFFKKRGKKAFEWYGEYGELCGILHKYIKTKDSVLVVGCGNSTLSCDLYDVGYKTITSIDLSNQVIEQMQKQNKRDRPDLNFETMDATQMDYKDSSHNVVLDKGTLDAMMPDDSDEVKANVNLMFAEIDRVLRFGGRYIAFTLLQPHILNHAVECFANDRGWPVRIVRCKEADEGKSLEERQFPVFALIATKFKKLHEMLPVLEIGLSSDGQLSRLKCANDLISSVRGIQQFAAVRAGVAKGNLFKDHDARHADPSLDLLAPASSIGGTITSPKYSLFLVDCDKNGTLKFAVFIVPQGREAEWLFSTKEGRSHLAASANCTRMVVVHLHREHTYKSLDSIKEELSGYAMELAPPDLESNTQVPFLSLGEDDVGDRTERCRGKSELSGEFVVEDVSANGELFRRLIFFNNKKLIQSEAKLKTIKIKKKIRKHIDTSYLACAHHSAMIGSLGFFEKQRNPTAKVKCLIIGLGGGALPSYISNHFSMALVDVVEIDPAIVRVATEHFDFKANDRLKVITCDGLKFINDFAAKKHDNDGAKLYDIVMFDVDSKDTRIGMSCPPKPFVEPEFLHSVNKCLKNNGIFVLNITCRDPTLRSEVLTDIKNTFQGDLISYQIPQEVNEIFLCWKNNVPEMNSKINKKHPAIQAFESVNKIVNEDLLDLNEALSQIRIM